MPVPCTLLLLVPDGATKLWPLATSGPVICSQRWSPEFISGCAQRQESWVVLSQLQNKGHSE